MRQLQLFTSTELAGMRDRIASPRHSPGHDTFRREHERHRAWGLIQRHGERLRRLRNSSCASPAVNPPESRQQSRSQDPSACPSPAPVPLEQEQCRAQSRPAPSRPAQNRPAQSRNTATNREPAHRREAQDGQVQVGLVQVGQVQVGQVQVGQEQVSGKDQPLPAHVSQGRDHHHAEHSRRPPSTPSRLAPTGSPLPPASPRSGENAHAIKPRPRSLHRTPQHNYRSPRKKPAGSIIHAALRPAIHHPDVSSRQPEKARGSPRSQDILFAHSVQTRGPGNGFGSLFHILIQWLR
jgi:hypothetical protein